MKALQGALDKITQEHGAGAVISMSGTPPQLPAIPSGVLPLDIALGIGGVPKGRIIEIFGPEASGKTTLLYHLMAQVQREGGTAAFIDAEHSMDARYAGHLGVDIEALIISQPDYGEQGLQIAQVLVESGAVDLVCVDSVAALTPKAEIEGQVGDQSVGAQARMMSQACRILAPKSNQSNTTVVFTNQLREKIGGMGFGPSETQPGGRALKFYASQRLDIRRIETIKDGTEAVGNRVRVKVVKNKVAAPYKQAEFVIAYGEGVDPLATLIEMHLADKDLGGVKKAGSFYTFPAVGEGSEGRAQGKVKAREYLAEHPEVVEALDSQVRHLYLDEGHDITDSVSEPGSDPEPSAD
jgi:recombination protein RecA